MDFPLNNLSSFHSELLANTELGRLCGQEKLFRDRYQVIRIIGRGGFGVTFLAKDVKVPATPYCVIKLLCPKVSSSSALATAQFRFEREAKTLRKLGNHPQIPTLIESFVLEGEFYLVQEYIQGGTLARLIRRNGPISETGVRQFLREMLPLLHYVHSNNVIHRDIKPQNIIRCQAHRRLVLIDFGAVKQIVQAEDTSVKGVTTHFIGTVGFAPPEQFDLRSVFSSDIYSLGVTCLYLLSGVGPLDFETDRHTRKLLWRHKIPNISAELGDILDQMLQPSPRDRFPSARSIIVALHGDQLSSNLFECLAAPPSLPVEESPPEEVYQSPHVKAAIAIREWKQKNATRATRKALINSSGS